MSQQHSDFDSKSLAIFMAVAGLSMALLVYVSNILVQTPIEWLSADWFNYAQFTFPLTFLITDIINRVFGARKAYMIIAVGFLVGGAMSILAGDVRIGIASITAFALGQFLDVTIFNRLRHISWWKAPLISSVLASLVDTTWFYAIAFAGSTLPWMQWASVDFAIKVLVALLALVPFRLLVAYIFNQRQAV